ncbi:peptidoglycan DD-metalloendopeptidase family protein [Pseudoxanthomonas sp. LjRoot143]|uniref:peptidoglycan DD-metalloendopeptidase family protein n=1 Tax=Pseudoxanthomonas sp. LjRoot143 TaxID=3342266 RepID=UPI003ECFF428
MTTTLRSGHRITRAFLIGIAMAVLGACSTTVVREPSGSSPPTRQTSQGKPGATVRVQRGDTLYGIAFRNGVDVNDLARWNNLAAPYTIYPGQSLKLFPGGSGSRPPATTATTPTKPATGTPTRPTPPPATVTRPTTTPVPASSGFSWRWPADGHLIGRYVAGDATKQGVDIAGSSGQAVRAAADGVVVYSGAGLVGYGELIIVKHSEAWLSAYGHNRKRLVNEGQSVKAGQQIAEMGSSGASREMLHFEIRHNGKPVDPLLYLPAR